MDDSARIQTITNTLSRLSFHERPTPSGDAYQSTTSRGGTLKRNTIAAIAITAGIGLSAIPMAVPATAAAPSKTVTCQLPPKGTDATAVATSLVTKFFNLIRAKDSAGMKAFLDKAWIAQTGDGTGRDRATFPTDLPTINAFAVDKINARLSDFLLTTRYLSKVDGSIAGKPYSTDFAPRLSTFSFCSGAWKMVSQANFDQLRPAAPPAS